MAKEFDIYLNKRLTECDIIVYSIPYRDGLTVFERLVLESCIENYTLQKFIAVQTGSELVAHIDEMLKTCHERLNESIELSTSAEFEVLYALFPGENGIELKAHDLDVLETSFIDFTHAIELVAAPLNGLIARAGNPEPTEIELTSDVYGTLKTAVEKASSPIVPNCTLVGTNKQSLIAVEPSIIPTTHMTDLLYRIYNTASSAIQLTAEALETEIHFSLGSGSDAIEIKSGVLGERITKYETLHSVVSILSEVTESLRVFNEPEWNPVLLMIEAEAVLKRHRLLEEMDGDVLSAYDDMTLEDIDYVIL